MLLECNLNNRLKVKIYILDFIIKNEPGLDPLVYTVLERKNNLYKFYLTWEENQGLLNVKNTL